MFNDRGRLISLKNINSDRPVIIGGNKNGKKIWYYSSAYDYEHVYKREYIPELISQDLEIYLPVEVRKKLKEDKERSLKEGGLGL